MILNKSITSLIQPNNTKLNTLATLFMWCISSQFIVLNVGPPKIHIYVTNYLWPSIYVIIRTFWTSLEIKNTSQNNVLNQTIQYKWCIIPHLCSWLSHYVLIISCSIVTLSSNNHFSIIIRKSMINSKMLSFNHWLFMQLHDECSHRRKCFYVM